MQDYRLTWANNTSWRWTRDLSAFATQIDAGAVVRMNVAFPGGAYSFASDSSGDGEIAIDGSYLAVFTAPLADLRAKKGFARIDCRIEMPDGSTALMFTGSLTVRVGVTTASGDSSSTHADGIADTVAVIGETDPTPVPLPAGLTAVLAACQAAQAAAEAAVAGLYSNAQIDAKDAATLQAAKDYSDAAVGAISLDWGSITGKPAFGALATTVAGTGVAAALAFALNVSGGVAGYDAALSAAAAAEAAAAAYTDGKITALVNGAPGILDTLGEIAAQLQADESAAALWRRRSTASWRRRRTCRTSRTLRRRGQISPSARWRRSRREQASLRLRRMR